MIRIRVALVSVYKDRDLTPPLGLCYLASYAKKYGGFNDFRLFDRNFDDIEKGIEEYKPDVIAMSSMTVFYNDAIKLAKSFKESLSAPVILGGVHISSLPESLDRCFDVAVIGEGEKTFLELLQLHEKNIVLQKTGLRKIKGIAFWDGKKVTSTERDAMTSSLDSIPIPDRSLLNSGYFAKKMIPHLGKHGIEGSMISSRGCPYRCVFCSTSAFWKRIRFFSPEYVIHEIIELVEKYKVNHITLWDDLFIANKERLRKISELLGENNLKDKLTFSCMARANLIEDELCSIMKGMNIKNVDFGFESGSEKVLKYLKQGTVTVEQNRNAIIKCKHYGFKVYGNLIFGSPTETVEDMMQTMEFIKFSKKNGVDALWALVMTPFPATEVWEIAKKRGVVSNHMNWDMLSHQGVGNPLVLDESVSKEEFKKVFLKAREELNFFRWKYVKENIRNDALGTFTTAIKSPVLTIKTIISIMSNNRINFTKK